MYKSYITASGIAVSLVEVLHAQVLKIFQLVTEAQSVGIYAIE